MPRIGFGGTLSVLERRITPSASQKQLGEKVVKSIPNPKKKKKPSKAKKTKKDPQETPPLAKSETIGSGRILAVKRQDFHVAKPKPRRGKSKKSVNRDLKLFV